MNGSDAIGCRTGARLGPCGEAPTGYGDDRIHPPIAGASGELAGPPDDHSPVELVFFRLLGCVLFPFTLLSRARYAPQAACGTDQEVACGVDERSPALAPATRATSRRGRGLFAKGSYHRNSPGQPYPLHQHGFKSENLCQNKIDRFRWNRKYAVRTLWAQSVNETMQDESAREQGESKTIKMRQPDGLKVRSGELSFDVLEVVPTSVLVGHVVHAP